MKVQFACVSLAALVAALGQSAHAADFSVGADGSVKDMSSPVPAVAVPAPVPVMEYKPQWYFRLDAGIGTVSEPDISERGYRYGGLTGPGSGGRTGDYTGDRTGRNGYDGTFADNADLQYLDPTWFTSDFSNLSTFGGGIGYYLGGGFRLDATVEKRSNDQAYIGGTETWNSNSYYDAPPITGVIDTYGTDANDNGIVDRRTTIEVSDRTDVDGTVWMANMYYDFSQVRGFTPYVGAGIGFVWNQLERNHTTIIQSCDNEANPGCSGGDTDYSREASTEANTISLAAAAMAGFSYQISDITSVDVGYRYLYLGGTDFAMSIDGVESRVEIGDQHVHQVRAGLRFDVN